MRLKKCPAGVAFALVIREGSGSDTHYFWLQDAKQFADFDASLLPRLSQFASGPPALQRSGQSPRERVKSLHGVFTKDRIERLLGLTSNADAIFRQLPPEGFSATKGDLMRAVGSPQFQQVCRGPISVRDSVMVSWRCVDTLLP